MKEPSIEEKARLYDEALARANEMIKDMTDIGGVAKVDDIQHIFPELKESKESEDEKIRKALMQNLKERFGTKGNMGKGLNMLDVLAWLEKKKEPQPVEWSDDDKATIKFLISHFCTCHSTNTFQFTTNEVITHDELLRKIRHLRPQQQWKPSKEQIKGIECAIKTLQHQLNVGDKRLNSLYDDLKKLRGE